MLVVLLDKHLVQKPAEVACELVISRVAGPVFLEERTGNIKYLSMVDVGEVELRNSGLHFLSHPFHHRIQHCKIAILTENDIDHHIVFGIAQSTDQRIHSALQIVGTIIRHNHQSRPFIPRIMILAGRALRTDCWFYRRHYGRLSKELRNCDSGNT